MQKYSKFLLLVVGVLGLTQSRADNSGVDPVLVEWRGNLAITRGEFDAQIQTIPERDRTPFLTSERRIGDLLNNMLLTQTLADDARKLGLDKAPLTQKEMAYASTRVLANKRIEAFVAALVVPDMTSLAREHYLTKPEEFRQPEQVRVSHVLVDLKTRTESDALVRAEEILAKARAGEKFALLAREYSDDSSAKNNEGDLGFFPRGRMAKPFEEAAFGLQKPGDISQIVKSQFGYHVILLVGKKEASLKPFEQVKDGLVEKLSKAFVERAKSEYFTSITTDKSINMNTEELAKLKVQIQIPPMESLPPPTK